MLQKGAHPEAYTGGGKCPSLNGKCPPFKSDVLRFNRPENLFHRFPSLFTPLPCPPIILRKPKFWIRLRAHLCFSDPGFSTLEIVTHQKTNFTKNLPHASDRTGKYAYKYIAKPTISISHYIFPFLLAGLVWKHQIKPSLGLFL